MKPWAFVLLMVFSGFFVSGCDSSNETVNNAPASTPAQAIATATPDEFANARATFKKDCTACHGEDGTGGLKTIDDKKLKVPSLLEGHALNHSDEDFVKQIAKGGDGMPRFDDKLTPEEINALVRFIRHDFQGK